MNKFYRRFESDEKSASKSKFYSLLKGEKNDRISNK